MHHPFMDLTGALRSKEGESPGKTREVRDGIFEEASKPPIEQAVAQFVFEFSEGPALQMFEHDAAQQTIRSNAWPAKVLGTEAPSPKFIRGQLQQLAVLEQFIEFIEGNVLDGGHFFGESEVEERR